MRSVENAEWGNAECWNILQAQIPSPKNHFRTTTFIPLVEYLPFITEPKLPLPISSFSVTSPHAKLGKPSKYPSERDLDWSSGILKAMIHFVRHNGSYNGNPKGSSKISEVVEIYRWLYLKRQKTVYCRCWCCRLVLSVTPCRIGLKLLY